jgi:hypothetical protein
MGAARPFSPARSPSTVRADAERAPGRGLCLALIAALSSQSAAHALAIGDFNTCRAYVDEAGAIDATAHYMDAIEQIGFWTCGDAAIPTAANIPGSAPGVTASASTTPFCRKIWPLAPVSSAIPTASGSPGSPITRR